MMRKKYQNIFLKIFCNSKLFIVIFSQNRLLLILLHSKFLLQTPDVSALLEAAVCQQEAQHQAASQGTLVTTEAPAVANEEEISNIVHTS